MAQKTFLRVEGDAVHIVTERVERTVRLGDLLDEVSRERGISTPILPVGCRMFRQNGDRSMFIIEQSPTTRSVVWSGMDEEGREQWKLAFPYIIFTVVFRGTAVSTEECRVFYRVNPLGNGDDSVLRTNLCNVYQEGRICTGDVRISGETLAQKAESFVANFWRSRFNSDLHDNNFLPAARQFHQVKSLAAWQEETARNPLFPLGVPWFRHASLADVVEGRV